MLVVGGGVMGLATARCLAAAGHRPTVLEQGTIPNPAGGSGDHHRLIRHAYGDQHGYAAMVLPAEAAWERLWSALGARYYIATGHLILGPPDDPWISASLVSLRCQGIPFERLDGAAIGTRYPMLDAPQVQAAVFVPKGGVLLAARIVRALADDLRRRHLSVVEGARVTELDPERARLTLADGRTLEGDLLLVAAGPWVGRLRPALAASVVPSRQVVVDVAGPVPHAPAWAAAPMLTHVLAGDAGAGSFYAVPPVAGTPLKLGDHRFGTPGDPDADRVPSAAEVAGLMRLAAGTLADAPAYRPVAARICHYDVAREERFVATLEGRCLTLAGFSGHGFKFGALVGERAAEVLARPETLPAFQHWLAGHG